MEGKKKLLTFALAFRSNMLSDFRRDGRVVDYNGLENRRAERHRGFESLSLRNRIKAEGKGKCPVLHGIC